MKNKKILYSGTIAIIVINLIFGGLWDYNTSSIFLASLAIMIYNNKKIGFAEKIGFKNYIKSMFFLVCVFISCKIPLSFMHNLLEQYGLWVAESEILVKPLKIKLKIEGTDALEIYRSLKPAVVAILLAPVFEEIFFRRYLIGFFKGRYTFFLITVSCLLFSIGHIGRPLLSVNMSTILHFFIEYIPFSVAISYVYHRFGLKPAILNHAILNVGQIINAYTTYSMLYFPVLIVAYLCTIFSQRDLKGLNHGM